MHNHKHTTSIIIYWYTVTTNLLLICSMMEINLIYHQEQLFKVTNTSSTVCIFSIASMET